MRSTVEALRPSPPLTERAIDARQTTLPWKKLSPTDDPPEIRGLVEKATQRDAESFGQLYELYIDRIYRHFYYRTGNHHNAEDLAERVFLNAWQSIGGYQDMGRPFVVWLLSIAHNLTVDYYRARKETSSIEDVIISDNNPENDPPAVAERQSDSEALRKAVGQLRNDQKAVVVMRYVDGIEYPEIAAVLNKSEGAVRVILSRALLNLRNIMGTNKEIDHEPLGERFGYDDLVRILGMNKRTLTAKILTAEKRGRLKLSTSPRSGKRFTREDAAAVLIFLRKDPSLAARL